MLKRNRHITIYGEHFHDFYEKQDERVQTKIDYVFSVIQTVERIPQKFLKHIEGTDGLFEIRVEVGSNIFRIFCCFDRGDLVVLFNAFQKKSQRTPMKEIALAEKLRREYFASKVKK